MGVGRRIIRENIERIRDKVAAAAGRARRDPADVHLVAVTKAADVEDIRTLLELGVADLGESRANQLTDRAEEIAAWLSRRRKDPPLAVRWHMVGHLQRNKVRKVLPVVSLIHSVDSLRLAEGIDRRAEQEGATAEFLLQVNCAEEPAKHGVAVGAAVALAEQICTLAHVRLRGLMTMAPLSGNPEKARPFFVRLRELFEEMASEKIGGRDFTHLSMGMTQDYEVAVEEGATLLRIGTALFDG